MTYYCPRIPGVRSFSRGRRTSGHSLDTWGGQGSWHSFVERRRWRCLTGCGLSSRHQGAGTDPSDPSSCSGAAGRSWAEADRFPLLCIASWTGRQTSHLHSKHSTKTLAIQMNPIQVLNHSKKRNSDVHK